MWYSYIFWSRTRSRLNASLSCPTSQLLVFCHPGFHNPLSSTSALSSFTLPYLWVISMIIFKSDSLDNSGKQQCTIISNVVDTEQWLWQWWCNSGEQLVQNHVGIFLRYQCLPYFNYVNYVNRIAVWYSEVYPGPPQCQLASLCSLESDDLMVAQLCFSRHIPLWAQWVVLSTPESSNYT